MSQENVEIATRALNAALRRPRRDVNAMNELFAAGHVLVTPGSHALGEGEIQGGDGYRAWREEFSHLIDFESDLQGAVDVTVKDGQVCRTEFFLNPADALKAAGFSE